MGNYCSVSLRLFLTNNYLNIQNCDIEVASDKTHPYAVNDVAYNSLIELCVDICKRNNIKQLLWKGDKSLIGQKCDNS